MPQIVLIRQKNKSTLRVAIEPDCLKPLVSFRLGGMIVRESHGQWTWRDKQGKNERLLDECQATRS